MKQNILRTILKYTAELTIIIFGVFVGMYFNEINNDKNLKQETEKSFELIRNEVGYNKAALETSIAYFETIKHNFDSIRGALLPEDFNDHYYGSEKFSVSDLGKWNGLKVAEFEQTSFQAIQITGIIKEFDIELIRDISKVYRLQEITTDAGDSIMEKLMSINSSTKVLDVIIMFRLITNDLLITQKRLLVEMEKLSLKL